NVDGAQISALAVKPCGGHSGMTVNPVQRPKMKTKIQQVIEIPPASRACGGGVRSTSQLCTPRTVTNSKISILIPARAMIDILTQNVVVVKYAVAWLMNRSVPAIAASTKAAQVHGRTSRASSLNGRLVEANPSRRKSTIAMVPITSEIAMTWITSMVVNAHLAS